MGELRQLSKVAINENTGPQGTINNDKIMRALLQYRNTPLKDVNKSPSQLLLGRQLRDGIPQQLENYKINPQWEAFARSREKTMAEAKLSSKEYHDSKGFKNQNPITVGQQVSCQNTRSRKWDRTGTVLEQRPHRQYLIKLHGSGRTSLRNRIHIKPLLHVAPHTPILNTPSTQSNNTSQTQSSSGRVSTSSKDTSNSGVPEVTSEIPRRTSRRRKTPDRYGEWVM